MADEVTFLDIAVLLKITPNTPLEKLGGLINASIFDASNLAGMLKQKDLISFTAYYPGPNSITVTDTGKALIADADAKSAVPLDALDDSVLQHLSGGKRSPIELQSTLNLRPKDLAMRLYKENKQGFITYELKNGTVDLMLTEKGFLRAKGGAPTMQAAGMPAPAPKMPTGMQQPASMPPPMASIPAPATPAMQPPAMPANGKKVSKNLLIFVVLIVILILALLLTPYSPLKSYLPFLP